jgi:hypothetical protein
LLIWAWFKIEDGFLEEFTGWQAKMDTNKKFHNFFSKKRNEVFFKFWDQEKIILFNRLPFGFDPEAKALFKSIARGTYQMFPYIGPNPLKNFLEFRQNGLFIIPQLSQHVAPDREIQSIQIWSAGRPLIFGNVVGQIIFSPPLSLVSWNCQFFAWDVWQWYRPHSIILQVQLLLQDKHLLVRKNYFATRVPAQQNFRTFETLLHCCPRRFMIFFFIVSWQL